MLTLPQCLRLLLGGLLLTIVAPFACGQGLAGQVIALSSDQSHYDIGAYARYLEDTNHLLNIQDFLSHPQDFNWHDGHAGALNFGYSLSAYWVRFELGGIQDPRSWLLEIGYPLLDNIQVYYVARGQVLKSFRTGDRRQFAERPIVNRNFVIPLPQTDNRQLTVYVRVATTGTMEIPMTLWRTDAFWTKEQPILVWKGLFSGLILVMVFYNLFIYLAVRETSYLYYVCYSFFVLMFQVSLDGIAYQFLWPSSPNWHEISFLLCMAFTAAFQTLFTNSFLNLRERAGPGGGGDIVRGLFGCRILCGDGSHHGSAGIPHIPVVLVCRYSSVAKRGGGSALLRNSLDHLFSRRTVPGSEQVRSAIG